MTWLLTILSLTGVVLNVKKHRACFLFWLPANLGWAILAFQKHIPAAVVLFGVYAGLAVWGIIKWRRR
jgi:nicotinamide riboside transporter PnuC